MKFADLDLLDMVEFVIVDDISGKRFSVFPRLRKICPIKKQNT